jgi:ankyrin repeat protein
MNPLHAAASSGSFKLVRILIEYDPAYINARDKGGSTPLLWASEGRYFKDDGSVLRFLLEHGADVNVQDKVGRTPLQYVSMNGTLEVVRLLLEHGADVKVKNSFGKTALQEAARKGRGEVVELLRAHGANCKFKLGGPSVDTQRRSMESNPGGRIGASRRRLVYRSSHPSSIT